MGYSQVKVRLTDRLMVWVTVRLTVRVTESVKGSAWDTSPMRFCVPGT